MEKPLPETIVADPWQPLRQFSPARIALGHAGISLPTRPQLEFQLAHARARDAVHLPLDIPPLLAALEQRGHEVMVLRSAAADRRSYLQRPDLGRRLDNESRRILAARAAQLPGDCDVAFVIADGLSAIAIHDNLLPFLDAVLPRLAREQWACGPIAIVAQGRVAVGDEVGLALRAQMVVILIGERPGLSAPDSLGIYLTYRPAIGTTDAGRNCISNVRRAGLDYEAAAHKLFYLMSEARRRKLSGVALKDEAEASSQRLTAPGRNILVETGG
ncbi:MAG: ethanolamine ammonia-lyase subunit EutC [Rhodocyclales bacterium]|nr:ethanolamine ammonia-lyase subunit EutC [Rhodocyclales bacterium]